MFLLLEVPYYVAASLQHSIEVDVVGLRRWQHTATDWYPQFAEQNHLHHSQKGSYVHKMAVDRFHATI